MSTCCNDNCTPSAAATEHVPATAPWSSRFSVPGMDCPAEESLIRLALQPCSAVKRLDFDLTRRELQVAHEGPVDPIAQRLAALDLGSRLLETLPASQLPVVDDLPGQARVLRWLLAINALMFCIEGLAGLLAASSGLIGDALDMLADAAVYGLALLAVGRSLALQQRAARVAGFLQALLAMGVLLDVARRALYGSEPLSLVMMLVAALALCANLACLALLARHRHGGVHMRASWLFSANDVLINLGVLCAGALVAWSGSPYPDLLIGGLIGLLVLLGARRILALRG